MPYQTADLTSQVNGVVNVFTLPVLAPSKHPDFKFNPELNGQIVPNDEVMIIDNRTFKLTDVTPRVGETLRVSYQDIIVDFCLSVSKNVFTLPLEGLMNSLLYIDGDVVQNQSIDADVISGLDITGQLTQIINIEADLVESLNIRGIVSCK